MHWHVVTGEYPPQPGGVSDYVHGLVTNLARAGEEVHVWCPPVPAATPEVAGVRVHRELGRMSPADLARVDRLLDAQPGPKRLLLQWVPHGFGYRSMNVAVCLWMLRRRRRGDRVEVMVHEPGLPFARGNLKQSIAAGVHRAMAALLLRAADRVWVATPAWERRWKPLAFGRAITFSWIPIPSAIAVADDPAAIDAVRARYAPAGETIVGHFGMYRPVVRDLLEPVIASLHSAPERLTFLLLGRGGEEFRRELVERHPGLAGRVHATGGLEPTELSHHLSACDLMLQPYPDGVNGRQSSMAAVLVHGRAAVSTTAESTEPMWAGSGAVALVATGDAAGASAEVRRLAADPAERARMGERARELYRRSYDWQRIVHELRSS